MIATSRLKMLIPVVGFVATAALVYVASTQWSSGRADRPSQAANKSDDQLEGVDGLVEGEVIAPITLTSMGGGTVELPKLSEKRVLCVFITPSCSGCAKDADLWKDLTEESTKRGVAFFIIDVGNDREALEKFAAAYDLRSLPILFDPKHQIGPRLKINLVPQYLLLADDGTVLHRWDGVRNYNRKEHPELLGSFFRSAY